MRVPLSWLGEFVRVDLEPEALAERLTLLGMEVRSIERRGDAWQHVVVGELLSVAPHPRADRLSLTRVTVGAGEPLEIVCGATNIAPGQRVPVALPGAVLPGNRRIERTDKMGVASNGMLCSGDELELTADADGILILAPDAPLGAAIADLYGDVVLDVDVKPNRGDALSIVGLAREVAAATGQVASFPEVRLEESGAPASGRLDVTVEDPALCPRFVGRWVAGVTVGPSPVTIQMRLIAAGMRPISNVVDASNYVMLELGKPIHTFDAAAVRGGSIAVRRARAGERLTTLDHVDRELDPETLVIADATGPIGIAGVMGGADSEVSEATRDVVVESAIFDPISIRRTAFRYALRSEASLRFEKGQERRLAAIGADRTAQLVAAWAGGTVAPGAIDTAPGDDPPARVAFRPARVNRLLGLDLAPDQQAEILGRVGVAVDHAPAGTAIPIASGDPTLSVAADDSALEAIVPSWRRDIAIEADLAEEIARVHGYDRIPPTVPATRLPAYRRSPLEVRDRVRDVLAGAGLSEAVSHALVAPAQLARLAWRIPMAAAVGETDAGGSPIVVTNPLSADHAVLRQALVGSLLDVVTVNVRRGRERVAIFEVGKGYGRVDGKTREWWRLGIALRGPMEPPAWNRADRPADVHDLRGVIDHVVAALGSGPIDARALVDEPLLHPGRAATVTSADADRGIVVTGRMGELHPAVAAELDLDGPPIVIAELSVAGLGGGALTVPRVSAPPRHPAVERDVAVVVGPDQESGALVATIRDAGGPLLRDVALFDVYRGAPLADDERSLAYRLRYSADGRTLTEAEVESAMAAVRARLTADGGRIRS